MGFPTSGRRSLLVIWLVLSSLLLMVAIWLHGVARGPSEYQQNHVLESTLTRLWGDWRNELSWAAQSALDHELRLSPNVKALLLVEQGQLSAFRSDELLLPEAGKWMAAGLGLLKSDLTAPYGVAYFRDQTLVVSIAEREGQKAIAFAPVNPWINRLNEDLGLHLALTQNKQPQRDARTLLVIPAATGGAVQLTNHRHTALKVPGFPWFWSVLISAFSSAFVLWFFWNRPIQSNSQRLADACRDIIAQGDYSARLPVQGSRAVAGLSIQINALISAVEYCYGLIAKTNTITTELLQRANGNALVQDASGMSEEAEIKASIDSVSRLSSTLEKDALKISVQPIFASDRQTIGSYDLTFHWLERDLHLVPLVDAVALCESVGLVKQATQIMIHEAIQSLHRLQAKTHDPIKVTMRLGSVQFTSAMLVPIISDLPPADRTLLRQIEFEILESNLTQDFDQIAATIAQLKGLGVGICIADFGLSRYSLMYLQRVPADRIKLARAFTEQVAIESRGSAFIEGVARFAAGLGITVVVKGWGRDQVWESMAKDLPVEFQDDALSAMMPLEVALAS